MNSVVKTQFTNSKIEHTKCELLFKIKGIIKREAEESPASQLHSFPRKQQRRYVEVYVRIKILYKKNTYFSRPENKKGVKLSKM